MTGTKQLHDASPRLPFKVIAGLSVRDYAYQWIVGCCPLHQWCSGGRRIDQLVIRHVQNLIKEVNAWLMLPDCKERTGWTPQDANDLGELLAYLRANEGHGPEKYIPDEFTPIER